MGRRLYVDLIGKHDDGFMNKSCTLGLDFKSYVLPILLLGAALSEVNMTLLEGKIPVKLSVGDLAILITTLSYSVYSCVSMSKIARRHIAIVTIGLAFILISLSTSCIHNEYWIISFKFCIKFCILFLLLVLVYQDSHISSGTLTALFVIMIFINTVGLLEYFYYDRMESFLLLFKTHGSLATYKHSYVSSIFPSTNTFAVFNVIFIVSILFIALHYPHMVNRYVCSFSLLLCIVGTFLSSSRNALLTLVIGVSFLVVSLIKNKKSLLAVSAVILITSMILISGLYIQKPLARRFADAITLDSVIGKGETIRVLEMGSAFNLKDRPDIWERGIDLFLEKPIFGIGASQYIMRNEFVNGDTIHMHNIFGDILVNHGIVGFALFMALIAAWFKNAKGDWQVYLIVTLFISHMFDCFAPYNTIWLIFTPWLVALTTRKPDELFLPDVTDQPDQQAVIVK